VYKPRGLKQERAPLVSLSKNSIVLNNIAREKLGSNRIELAFDNESSVIRIRGVNEGGMELRKTKVFGKGFFKQFDIDRKGRFVAIHDDGALYVKIS
jgi:hypothetical protein